MERLPSRGDDAVFQRQTNDSMANFPYVWAIVFVAGCFFLSALAALVVIALLCRFVVMHILE
jgi:hypothetical protein